MDPREDTVKMSWVRKGPRHREPSRYSHQICRSQYFDLSSPTTQYEVYGRPTSMRSGRNGNSPVHQPRDCDFQWPITSPQFAVDNFHFTWFSKDNIFAMTVTHVLLREAYGRMLPWLWNTMVILYKLFRWDQQCLSRGTMIPGGVPKCRLTFWVMMES